MVSQYLKGLLASLALLVTSFSASAATDSYGDLLSGSYTPPASFATLSYSNVGNVYNFTLTAADLDALFTTGAFIGAIAVDAAFTPTVSNVSGGSPVSVSPGGGPGGIFDFRFDLTGPKQARLTANESVSWTATFANPVNLTSSSFALHVQSLTDAQGGSAWYTVSAVPEAETYAMLIAGMGLLGFMARRRRFD